MTVESDRTTYVLIDGENIDATLGASIFGRRPHPNERPRWERILTFAESTWGQPAKGLFFLAVKDELPMSFIQALVSIGYRPIPLSGGPTDKVVDIAIQRTLDELENRDADLMLVSNDGDFLPQMETAPRRSPDGAAGLPGVQEQRLHRADRPGAGVLRPRVRRPRVQRAAAARCGSSRSTSSTPTTSCEPAQPWVRRAYDVRRPARGHRTRAAGAPAARGSRSLVVGSRSAVCRSVITRLRRATPTSLAARFTAGP